VLAGGPANPLAADELNSWKSQIAARFGVATDKVKILIEL
jgi:hypothetical protein